VTALPGEPLSLDEAVKLMLGFAAPWWIAGGWAIDLHAERVTREHADVDIAVLFDDRRRLRAHLAEWDLADTGHGVRARRDPQGPWELEITYAVDDDGDWVYARDPSIRVPLADAILRAPDGTPYERPELALLMKSGHEPRREKDEYDFATALPLLDETSRTRLREWLAPDDPWQERL
jgi:aminoglycoside-2''-adenylyltransferase